jgi:hypothetical protein
MFQTQVVVFLHRPAKQLHSLSSGGPHRPGKARINFD